MRAASYQFLITLTNLMRYMNVISRRLTQAVLAGRAPPPQDWASIPHGAGIRQRSWLKGGSGIPALARAPRRARPRHSEHMGKQTLRNRPPAPPALDQLPLVHSSEAVAQWLDHYWQKLNLPREVAGRLAVTSDRQEFAQWTGRRLNPMALGCYCYLPNASGDVVDDACGAALQNAEGTALAPARSQPVLPGFGTPPAVAEATFVAAKAPPDGLTADHRHLIFIEPGLLPVSIEVTVAHELIHLSDRVRGTPRKHRCHGYDSISVDEAALTQRDPEYLRAQLREETVRREQALRAVRPYRFVYVCPNCGREYPRVRRYTRQVSCGRCDQTFNAAFILALRDYPGNQAPSEPDRGDAASASA